MTTGNYNDKRDRLKEAGELYELYREFELQWYPNEDADTTLDFLLWLDREGYLINRAELSKD